MTARISVRWWVDPENEWNAVRFESQGDGRWMTSAVTWIEKADDGRWQLVTPLDVLGDWGTLTDAVAAAGEWVADMESHHGVRWDVAS